MDGGQAGPPRDELYAKIDQRYPIMLAHGGIDEARSFAARCLDPSLPLMKAVGLPPLLSYFKEEIDLDEAVALSCRDSRRYAKRQTTWFNNQLQDNICEDFGYEKQFSESFFEKILSIITFGVDPCSQLWKKASSNDVSPVGAFF